MVDANKSRLLPRSSQKDMPLKLTDYCFGEVAGVLKVRPGTMGRLYVRNSPRPDGDPAEPSFARLGVSGEEPVTVYSCIAARCDHGALHVILSQLAQ